MKKVFIKMLGVAAVATMCGVAFAANAPITVSLNISHPKESVTKTGDGKSKGGDSWSNSTTEVKNSVFEYTGKVNCSNAKENVTVTLEAYFITRALGEKGAKDELGERKEIEKFEFGGENPKLYKYTLSSPTITQTTVTMKDYRGRKMREDKTGSRLMGVIVRAMVDGKPVKVISEPSNMRWVAAGKKETIEL